MEKNHLKDPEYIIAYAIALISICALVVSIQQTRIMSEQRSLMHEQAKAAVWPRLSLGVNKSHSLQDRKITDYALIIGNDGVGPAIITNMRVSFNGNIASNWWSLFEYFNLPDSVPRYITNANINHNILRAGQDIRILQLGSNLPLAQAFYENSDSIEIEIYYESIYGDKWKYSSDSNGDKTESIEAIPVFSEKEDFQN